MCRQRIASTQAVSAPSPPPAAITVAGETTWAAAPASMRAAPWPVTVPVLARPNAWARRPSGTQSTNAVFAAIW